MNGNTAIPLPGNDHHSKILFETALIMSHENFLFPLLFLHNFLPNLGAGHGTENISPHREIMAASGGSSPAPHYPHPEYKSLSQLQGRNSTLSQPKPGHSTFTMSCLLITGRINLSLTKISLATNGDHSKRSLSKNTPKIKIVTEMSKNKSLLIRGRTTRIL